MKVGVKIMWIRTLPVYSKLAEAADAPPEIKEQTI